MQHGKIIATDSPQNLYNTPQNKYIASLFGEVNELELNGKTHLVYPHQLKLDSNGSLLGTVKQSYFKGSYYLVEVSSDSQTLFFENDAFLPSGASIRLEILNKTAYYF